MRFWGVGVKVYWHPGTNGRYLGHLIIIKAVFHASAAPASAAAFSTEPRRRLCLMNLRFVTRMTTVSGLFHVC